MSVSANHPLLYVVRHGATEWSRSGQHTGRTDLPLLPEGEEQARATGSLLANIDFSLVLCSPMQRARRTCELAGLLDCAVTENDLQEWDYGDYEGVTTPKIRETVPGWTVWSGVCPNGETIEQVSNRADRVIERVRNESGNVIVFAHGHILRILTARWCELDPVEGRRFILDPATLSILGWERETPAIRQWNSR
ncbi:MAG: histidine phosphatase family protein [Actinobacteria bacterium]|nr:histidine phosphatase family protein [Actinomycetota bacterium]